MNKDIKDLRQRVSTLEIENKRIIEIINGLVYAAQASPENYSWCECGINVLNAAEDSCSNNDCPHGLCKIDDEK